MGLSKVFVEQPDKTTINRFQFISWIKEESRIVTELRGWMARAGFQKKYLKPWRPATVPSG
jgi:hypothetical protein